MTTVGIAWLSQQSLRWKQQALLPDVARSRYEHETVAVEDLNHTNTPTIARQRTDERQRIPVLKTEN